MKGSAFVIAGVLLALVLPGCGDDAATGETDGETSKAAFISHAETICKTAKDEIIQKNVAQVRKLAKNPKAREALEYKLVETAVIPALEHEVEQLKALGAPAGDEAQIEQMVKLIEGALAEAKSEPETYVSGDDYRWGSEHFGKAHRLAVAYGLKSCPMSE